MASTLLLLAPPGDSHTLQLDRGTSPGSLPHPAQASSSPSPSSLSPHPHPPAAVDASGSSTSGPAEPSRKRRLSGAEDDARLQDGQDTTVDAGETATGQSTKRTCKVRKRLQLACANCRRRKTKCTGTFPTCGHCLRARIPCVYKTSRRPAAPRSNYMTMLDQQMQKMSGRILGLAMANAVSSPCPARSTEERAHAVPRRASTLNTNKNHNDDDKDDDLDDDDFWNGVNEPGEENRDSPPPATVDCGSHRRTAFMAEGMEYLPPVDIQEHLSKIFFTHLYGQPYFLLHKPSYMSKLRAGKLPPVLILTVCAIAARFSAHPGIQMSPKFLSGDRWASCARRICTARLDRPNLTLVTCLCLLSLHDFGTCHGARSWALGGQAIRMAFALRLHREDEPGDEDPDSPPLSFVDKEIRRRIMWACFIIDRFNSSSTARPIFIRDEMIKIPEPIREDSFQMGIPRAPGETPTSPLDDDDWEQGRSAKDSASVAAHMVRAVSIWGKIVCYLNQGGRDLDPHPMWDPRSTFATLSEQAENMPETLPASLAYNDVSVSIHEADNTIGQFFFLHTTIQQNIVALNHAILASPQGVPRASLSRATTKAFVSAARISHLLSAIGSRPVNAPFVGYSAFSSAMVQLEGIFCGNPWIENSTRRRLTSNIRYLHRMKHHWGVFHWMIEKIRARYCYFSNRAKERVRGASHGSAATNGPVPDVGSRDIGDYAEWFDRYPRGVSHMNFVDPAERSRGDSGDEGVLEQKPDWITVGEYLARTAPPVPERPARGPDTQESPGGDSDNELERLLMSLDESSMPDLAHLGMPSLPGQFLNNAGQFTGDTVPLGNAEQVPGAYYDFMDGFPAAAGLVNPCDLPAPTMELGAEFVMPPQEDLGQPQQPPPPMATDMDAAVNGDEQQLLGDEADDLDMRDSDEIIDAWASGLDDIPARISAASVQDLDLGGFEGCEGLSALQPYVM